MLCQQVGLFAEALVAIDGSKFKTVNNRDRNFTQAKMQRRMDEIEASINRYLAAMDSADRQEPAVVQAKTERLQGKIDALKAQMRELKDIEAQLDKAPDKQISLTDPDARSMKFRDSPRCQRSHISDFCSSVYRIRVLYAFSTLHLFVPKIKCYIDRLNSTPRAASRVASKQTLIYCLNREYAPYRCRQGL